MHGLENPDRFGGLTLENGAWVVYDKENSAAWLQSTNAVDLADKA